MFRSKRDSADIISPLAPPAETSRTRDLHNSNSGHGNGTALNRGMQSRGGPEISGSSTQGGPMYSAGGNMNRQTSIDTTASSSKGEKRRSGFFGLSKKKEEKKEPVSVYPHLSVHHHCPNGSHPASLGYWHFINKNRCPRPPTKGQLGGSVC